MDYPVPLVAQLSQQLRALRKARGLSQTQLAQRLGVSQTRVAAIERDPAVVSVGQLFEVLRLLDVQVVLRDLAPAPTGGVKVQDAEPATRFGTPTAVPRGEW